MAKKNDSGASSADDKANQVRNERMLSQIESIKQSLANSPGNARPTTKPTKRRGRGISEIDFLTGNDSTDDAAGKPKKKGSSRSESKANAASSRQRNAALQDIIYDYDLSDHPERDAIAQSIYNEERGRARDEDGSEEAQVAREIGDNAGLEDPQGLPGRYDESIGDTAAEDLESGQRIAGLIDSAMGTRVRRGEVNLEGGSSSSKDEPARRRPSRNTELALGMGRPRGPMEADPNDYWTGREAPTSAEHAQSLLEESMRNQALWRDPKSDPRDLVNFGSADPDLPRSSVAEGTESVGKVNKPIREENDMRLYVARLEDAIKTGKFGPTTGSTRGTVPIAGVGAVPIQRLSKEEGGLDEETKDLLLSNQSGAILRRGEDAGVSRAVKGTFDIPAQVRVQVPAVADTQARDKDGNLLTNEDGTPKMQGAQTARTIRTTRDVADRILARTEGATELDPEHRMVQGANGEVSSRDQALALKVNEETGEQELANPLQNVLPTITDANGVTRPNPAYPVRSEQGVPIQKTEQEENDYRMQLGDQLVSKSSGKQRPLSLAYIKGEGRRRYRKRQVRADYKGPVQQETVAGIGPVYGSIRANLAGGQFDQGTGQTTDPNTGRRINVGEGTEAGDVTETMIQIGGSEDVTRSQIERTSQSSDLRPETPSGDLERARRGRLQSLNTGKNVPVLIAYDRNGNPLLNKRVDTVVGATSSVQSERGSKERRRVSIEDTANMFGGPALTDTVPVMVPGKDAEGNSTDVPLENRDYPAWSARRVVTTERTRQPYDVLKRVLNPVTKKREAYRVSDRNAEIAGQTRSAARGRILRLNQMMNRGVTNQPAPGADPTVRSSDGTGSEFLRDNTMNPIYDPEFAARVGTPEEVRTRAAAEQAAAAVPPKPPTKKEIAAKEKAKVASEQSYQAGKVARNAAKPGLIQAASEADVEFELNGKRFNSAGALVGDANPLGVSAPESLDRGAPRMSPMRPVRDSVLPGIDTMAMPAAGTRTVTPRSGKNKGIPKEVPDVTQGKTKGFQDRYREAYRQSPRGKFMKEKTSWDQRMEEESSDLDTILAGGVPNKVMAPAPSNWRDLPADSPALANVGREKMFVPKKVAAIGGPIRESKLVYKSGNEAGTLVPEKEASAALSSTERNDKDFGIGGSRSSYRFEKYPELLARKLGPQFGG
jgi:hypothetical protein